MKSIIKVDNLKYEVDTDIPVKEGFPVYDSASGEAFIWIDGDNHCSSDWVIIATNDPKFTGLPLI